MKQLPYTCTCILDQYFHFARINILLNYRDGNEILIDNEFINTRIQCLTIYTVNITLFVSVCLHHF